MEKVKLVLNVGINDADYSVTKEEKINGKRIVTWRCPYYSRWYNLLSRCYSKAALTKRPLYGECSICSEWLVFSNFKSWMITQDWENKQLDKDLKILGNKIYSPDTCLFISDDLNRFLNENESKRGNYPIGVTAKSGKFASYVGNKHISYHETPESAHESWLIHKMKMIDGWMIKEPNVSVYLQNYKNLLNSYLIEHKIYDGRRSI